MLPDPGKWPLAGLWLAFFIFTALVAMFVQLWFLPTFLPGGTSENGLLLATDSIGYHSLAVEMAERILLNGWSEWVLAPKGWTMVGFTAAVYVISTSEPWAIIPLNAAAHATCGAALFKIAQCFTSSRRTAFIATLPYILFPSASFWYTQLLKDGFYNMGFLTFLAGWVYLIRARKWQDILIPVLSVSSGYIILGLFRPYMMSVSTAATVFVVVTCLVFMITGYFRRTVTAPQALGRLTVIMAMFGFQVIYPQLIAQTPMISAEAITQESRGGRAQGFWVEENVAFIPRMIDNRLMIIAGTRDAYIRGRPDALSTLDRDVRFETPSDIAAYIPRAAQIVFLAPFPDMWLGTGSTAASTIMRRVSILEMLATYGLMLGIPFALWSWRCRVEIWSIATLCGSVLIVYGLASPNMGTLYRVRYGYLMVFLSLGVLGWDSIRQLAKMRDNEQL